MEEIVVSLEQAIANIKAIVADESLKLNQRSHVVAIKSIQVLETLVNEKKPLDKPQGNAEAK